MGDFKRNPSKVWWGSDSVEWREVSSSPGSQDSGFSDSEPKDGSNEVPKAAAPTQNIAAKDIVKEFDAEERSPNLSANYREKTTPDKSIKSELANSLKGAGHFSTRTTRFMKNSPKVSRNLFNVMSQKESMKDVVDVHQYSEGATSETHSSTSGELTLNGSYASSDVDFDTLKTQSLQLPPKYCEQFTLNKTAPAVVQNGHDDEESTSFICNNSLSSDCESELECLFNGSDSPKHTSTPLSKMRHQKYKLPLHLYLKTRQERVPLLFTDNKAVQRWMEDVRRFYDQECMTTLQCKSIAAELNQKVSQLASSATEKIRNILTLSHCIEREYQHLNSEKKHVGPLAQSLGGNIVDFFQTYNNLKTNYEIVKEFKLLQKSNSEEALNVVSHLFTHWQLAQRDILDREVKGLVERVANPVTELDLRATITGITSICLRHEKLIEMFTQNEIITVLLILCEKCDGSSTRSLLLRALSTLCCSAEAVRQFEKFSGAQIVADTLEDQSRPEPEKSEAVALLAQVTAPWIEENHSVRGLSEHSRKIVKALTQFIATTKCCQNLLLSTAALANLSTMDPKCIKPMLYLNTIPTLLESVKKRGPRVSIYLYEQVATLLANVSAKETARKFLTNANAPEVLLSFLKISATNGEDVEKRLQQKSIIGLSRLCSDCEAARQIVDLGGVEKLVKMCREKSERYDSDAVLVATLATLRKIVDNCGRQVINAEDAQEFVQPKLLDSFLAYSTQSESYV